MPNIYHVLNNSDLPCSSTAKLDIGILTAHVLGKNRSFLYAFPDYQLTITEKQNLHNLITTRKKGVPIAYILGFQDFWNLRLKVNQHTLIPRPETELLVEQILHLLPNTKQNILELGTGSGAISLALASERHNWQITATDISEQALQIAKFNAQNLNLNVQFKLSNWFTNIYSTNNQKFNAIISNPPYIAENDRHLTIGDVRFEPKIALISGKEGLNSLTNIITNAPQYLVNNGYLLLEHGFDQGAQVRQIMHNNNFNNVITIKDLSNLERLTLGQLK